MDVKSNEIKMSLKSYILYNENCLDVIEYVYAIILKYICNEKHKDKHKYVSLVYIKTVFNIDNSSNVDTYSALHLTLMFIRSLLLSQYNSEIGTIPSNKPIGDLDDRINSNTCIKLVNSIVAEINRTNTILIIKNIITTKHFDTFSVQTLIFKILKLVELSKGNMLIVKTKVIIRPPLNFGEKPRKTNIISSYLNIRTPKPLNFNILLCKPSIIYKENYSISVSCFMFRSHNTQVKIKVKRDTEFNTSFLKNLDYLSSTPLHVDTSLFEFAKKNCLNIIISLKSDEGKLIEAFKDFKESSILNLRGYRNLLLGDFPKNLEDKYRSNIDALVLKRISGELNNEETKFNRGLDKLLNYSNTKLNSRIDDIKIGMLKNNKYIDVEVCKVDTKIKELQEYIKNLKNLCTVTDDIYKKLKNVDFVELKQVDKNYDLVNNCVNSELFNEKVDYGYTDTFMEFECNSTEQQIKQEIVNTFVVDITTNSIGKTLSVDNKINLQKFKDIEFEFKEDKKRYENNRKEYKKWVAKLQHHLSNIALVNLFLDYYDFIKDNNIKIVYFFTYACFRGRIYYSSIVSPQSNSLFRYLYHFGCCNEPKTPILPEYMECEDLLIKSIVYNGIALSSISVLFSIGIIFKNKVSKECGKILFADIIKIGLDKYLMYKSGNKPHS